MRGKIKNFYKNKLNIEKYFSYTISHSTLNKFFTVGVIDKYFKVYKYVENPHFRCAGEMKLYDLDDVIRLTYDNKIKMRFVNKDKPLEIDYKQIGLDFKMNYIDNVFHNLKTLLDSETKQ